MAIGFTLAGIIQIPFLAFGADAVFRKFPEIYDALLYCGAVYLIWRGAKLCYRSTAATFDNTDETTSAAPINELREGVIASLLNPKGFIFMVAFLPQFVNPALGNVAWQIVTLGIILKAVALALEISVALTAGSLGNWLSNNPAVFRWQKRFTGTLMIILGVRLIFSGGDVRTLARP